MKLPSNLKPCLWSAAAGAAAISVVGFSMMGWMLGSTAERNAVLRANSAVAAAVAPICVEKFMAQEGAAAKLTAFARETSWDQRSQIEKGGWAKTPGTKEIDSTVVGACAAILDANAKKGRSA